MVKKTTAKDGDHVVTMREVAKAAGVSIKTVSNVVNDYEFVSDATRAKVHKAIDELGYVINVSARNLRRGSTGIIALAIPDLQLSYFAQLSSLIITEAKKLGLRVIVEPTLYSREGELDALHGSQTAMVDGLIYSPLELGPDDAAEVEVDYPLVLIGERIFTDKVDHIATENVEGAKRATSYLLQTGCKRVAVVGVHPGEEVGSAALRFRGYREALEEAGVPFDPALVVPSIMWHRNDGVAAMNTLLDSGVRPDGVVALNDMLASGVMHSIQMHDLRIPEDISVIGFDNSDDSQYLSPALTSIAPGLEAVARLSVRWKATRRIPSSARCRPRWSCAAPPARSEPSRSGRRHRLDDTALPPSSRRRTFVRECPRSRTAAERQRAQLERMKSVATRHMPSVQNSAPP